MSVINQLLIDLEKRSASGAERRSLPNHVRVMPHVARRSRAYWIAGAGLAVAALLAAWAALQVSGGMPRRAVSAVPPASAPVAVKAAAAKPAQVIPESSPERLLAARLSFELSRLPDPLPEPEARPASIIASARIVGKSSEGARAMPARAVPAAVSRAEGKLSTAAPTAVVVATAPTRAAELPSGVSRVAIDKRVREPTPRERAEAEYRRASALMHQGRKAEAIGQFEAALALYPAHHEARQALLGLLVDAGRGLEAERAMQDGLEIAPHQVGFAMALARLQLDRGDAAAAIGTLQNHLAHGQGNGTYLAFLAGVLQREQRYAEAVEQFQAALRLRPNNGVWLLGLGMSLQALERASEAREAFGRARASPALSPDLQAFADQRLQQLR